MLNEWGYGNFNGDLIQRGEDKQLSLTDEEEMWSNLYDYYMDHDDDDFKNRFVLGTETEDGDLVPPYKVRNALINYGPFTKTMYLNKFTENESVLDNPKKQHLHTPLFRDNKDEVYTFFKNGVVKTTKDGSILQTYDTIKDGYIWETQIRNEVDNIDLKLTQKGLFEEFVEKCMSVKDEDGEWKLNEEEYKSFRTIYGYLLSNYTNNGETPCPIFVDRESDGIHAEGGNGKSLVMKSVKHWKKTTPINGKNVDSTNRFVFSGVKLDTEFVFLDDVNADFPFKIIYNYTTGDMEIERKGIDRFVIPEDIKPKIGVCTNYIMSDISHSTSRRQHIVEFSSFWNEQSKKGISVEDYLGKRLIDKDFTNTDWNHFYNFGFKCIQEYLKNGVLPTNKSNYQRKQFISLIEGDGVNDGVVLWLEAFCKTNEKIKDQISWNELYFNFTQDTDQEIIDKWSLSRLKKALWDICKHNKWDFNPHKVGQTLSAKRWKTGPKGQQVESIRIITK